MCLFFFCVCAACCCFCAVVPVFGVLSLCGFVCVSRLPFDVVFVCVLALLFVLRVVCFVYVFDLC